MCFYLSKLILYVSNDLLFLNVILFLLKEILTLWIRKKEYENIH